jgi:hypothetical protein
VRYLVRRRQPEENVTPPLQVLTATLAAVAVALLVFFTTPSTQGTQTPLDAEPTLGTEPPPATQPPPDSQAPPEAEPSLVTSGAQYFSSLPADFSETQYALDSPAPVDGEPIVPCVVDQHNLCPVSPPFPRIPDVGSLVF